MAIKIKSGADRKKVNENTVCYKIIRKTVKFQHIMENDDSIADRFKNTYETILSSYDITDYVENHTEWVIPTEIIEEIRTVKALGIFPRYRIVSEGFIFAYTRQGIIDYMNALKHCQTVYGKSHFNDDLRIYRCEIPAGTDFYEGTNNGLSAYASKSLVFEEDITNEIL